ncbi:MAG: hypothetical protein Unbinned3556contig1001_43 [Prokaryotic dsDNA virus sp.]|nr:MAG: hypothetical protein Unbinned3556contig1001_43 [Prokaryotic dsDNA virus sp.]|tara:strand:- start:3841 stop:4347 length:507 start_codon:yes stop_codon:yes gene_type:complete
MVKVKKNFSFKRAAFFINKNIADSLNLMAVFQNEAIQRGIANKTDINGKRFEPLKESTLEIRNKRKQGFTPLDRMKGERAKKLRNTKIEKATQSKLISKVKMMTDYGVFHNEGFDVQNNFMKNKKSVPARRWFGISKEMRSGGNQHKKFIRMALFKIQRSLSKFNADT